MTGIYCYTNTINGKKYVGQAVDLERRKKDHKVRAFNNYETNSEYNSSIHQAFRKYGYEAFEYTVLEECSVTELNNREIYWIAHFDSHHNGYNQDDGGTERHFCKLNPDILELIRYDLVNTDMTFDEIRIKHNVSIGFVSDFNSGKIWYQEGFDYPFRPYQKKEHFCLKCGKKLFSKSKTGKCSHCAGEDRRVTERPSRDVLKELIRNDTFVSIGKNYGVTDNTVRKWCDGYGLPRKKSDIRNFTDEEWNEI